MNQPEKIDVLAIGAHPDDVELHAGGTLHRLADLGYTTAIVDLTRGEASTRGTVAQRGEEAFAAASVLGVKFRETLDLGDARLIDSEANRSAVVLLLRKMRPQLVLTHYADQPHPDHMAASAIVAAAVYLAGVQNAYPCDDLLPHRPNGVLHFGLPRGIPPSFVVDVSRSEEEWERAVRCHRSQWYDPSSCKEESAVSQPEFLSRVIARRRADGAAIGAKAGEAFWTGRVLSVENPCSFFARPFDVLP